MRIGQTWTVEEEELKNVLVGDDDDEDVGCVLVARC